MTTLWLQIAIGMLGAAFVAFALFWNVLIIERRDRREIAAEMREAMKWADHKRMRQQSDYRNVLRGK